MRGRVSNMQKFKINQACIFLGKKCNLSCKYCYNNNKASYIKSMTKKQISQIIDFLLNNCGDTIWISFSGGEPFVYPQLVQYTVDLCKKANKKVYFNVTTNGTILNKKLIDSLINNNTYFCVSLDGDKQAQNESRNDSYEKTIKFIKYLKDKDYAKLRVRMTIQPNASKRLYKNVEHINHLGINEIHFAPNYEAKWTNLQIKYFFEQVKRLSETDINIEPIQKFREFKKPFKIKKGAYEHECGLLLTFAPDGNIYPCPRLVFEKSCTISNKLSASSILLGIAEWSELLQTARNKIKSNFFCLANNIKIKHNSCITLPIFKKFEEGNNAVFNPRLVKKKD